MLSTGVVNDGCDWDLLLFQFCSSVFTAIMQFETKSMREGLITYLAHEFFILFDMFYVLLLNPSMHNFHVFLKVEPCGHLFEASWALVLYNCGGGFRLNFDLNLRLRYGGKYLIFRNKLFLLFLRQLNGLHWLFNRFLFNYLAWEG